MILLFLKWFVPHMLGTYPGFGRMRGQDCAICYWQTTKGVYK